jgi:hypothetical protein
MAELAAVTGLGVHGRSLVPSLSAAAPSAERPPSSMAPVEALKALASRIFDALMTTGNTRPERGIRLVESGLMGALSVTPGIGLPALAVASTAQSCFWRLNGVKEWELGAQVGVTTIVGAFLGSAMTFIGRGPIPDQNPIFLALGPFFVSGVGTLVGYQAVRCIRRQSPGAPVAPAIGPDLEVGAPVGVDTMDRGAV